MDIAAVRASIQDILYQWTGVRVNDTSINLFDSSLAIRTPDFLYVFAAMEKEFSMPAFNFLNEEPYTNFNIDCLSEYIYNLIKN